MKKMIGWNRGKSLQRMGIAWAFNEISDSITLQPNHSITLHLIDNHIPHHRLALLRTADSRTDANHSSETALFHLRPGLQQRWIAQVFCFPLDDVISGDVSKQNVSIQRWKWVLRNNESCNQNKTCLQSHSILSSGSVQDFSECPFGWRPTEVV